MSGIPRRPVSAASRAGASALTANASRLFAFGTIDVGIGGRIDDRVPWLGRDHARAIALRESSQIEIGSTWRHNLDIFGAVGERADLLADLAGSAEQKEAHPSRALLGQAAAAGGIVCATTAAPTRRGSRGTISRSREAPLSKECLGGQPSSALSLPKSIA